MLDNIVDRKETTCKTSLELCRSSSAHRALKQVGSLSLCGRESGGSFSLSGSRLGGKRSADS